MSRSEAALARRRRESALTPADYRRALRDLHTDWPEFLLITISSTLIREAGTITEHYRVRAYDAVHLAASLAVQAQAEETVTFACWDRALAEVAVRAGLQLFPIV